MDVEKVIDYLSLVYWEEINNNDSYYIEAFNCVKALCEKYGVSYRSSSLDIIKDITDGKYDGYSNFLDTLDKEKSSCSSVDDVSDTLWKMQGIREDWRKIIMRYVTKYDKLYGILDGDLENINVNISSILPREFRLQPQEKMLFDSFGFPILNDDGEFVCELETEEDVRERVEREDRKYEEMLNERDNFKDSLSSWMEYLIALPEISKVYKTLGTCISDIDNIKSTFILDDYNKDLDFMDALDDIMKHDTEVCEYLYHGTDGVESANNILEQGLYMQSPNLGFTTYSEFSRDDLLLYSRGFAGEIGSSAIIVIKRPMDEEIVREVTEDERASCSVISSGLAGLDCEFNYIVPKEYIVGYVDKANRCVVHQKDLSLNDSVSK